MVWVGRRRTLCRQENIRKEPIILHAYRKQSIFKSFKKKTLMEVQPFSVQGIVEYSLTLDVIN